MHNATEIARELRRVQHLADRLRRARAEGTGIKLTGKQLRVLTAAMILVSSQERACKPLAPADAAAVSNAPTEGQ